MSVGELLLLLILHFFAPHKLPDLSPLMPLAFIQRICELPGPSLYRKVIGKLDLGLLCALLSPTWFLGCKGGPLNGY